MPGFCVFDPVMQCHVFLKRKDGIVVPVAELSPEPTPKRGDVISVNVDHTTVRARVDGVRHGNTVSQHSAVESVCYIDATEL